MHSSGSAGHCRTCRYSSACTGLPGHIRTNCTDYRPKKQHRARYGTWNEMGYHKIAVANAKSWRQRLYDDE